MMRIEGAAAAASCVHIFSLGQAFFPVRLVFCKLIIIITQSS